MNEHTHILEDGSLIIHSHDENSSPEESNTLEQSSASESTHVHNAEHSHGHSHSHEHDHSHGHGHSHGHHHENTKAVLNRMNRAIGHMESIKRMVEDGRDCSEVLIQIAAVRSAINNIGKVILEDHINHCIVDAVETGDEQVLKDLNEAISKFVK